MLAFLWLAVFLMTVICLQPSNQDANSPIHNITVDPKRGILAWDLNGNVDEIMCNKSMYLYKARNNQYCQLPAFSSCRVTNYTITITKGPSFSTMIQYPAEEGKPGTAAENLTCWVHDKDFLQCTWVVGSAAPRDVQYYLYIKEERHHFEEHKCPRYRKDTQGRHVGCHFDDISRLKNNLLYRFMVNGTSKTSRVSCVEDFKPLIDIEVLSPPNITGWCNKSYSFMGWKIPSLLNSRLSYELQIQKNTDAVQRQLETMKIQENKNYTTLNNPGTYTVRIRTQRRHSDNQYSAWSPPQRFECGNADESSHSVWRTSLLIALGILLALGLAALLCRRYSVIQKIFPSIPRVRDPIKDNFRSDSMMVWDGGRACLEECPVEELQVVEKS